MDVIIEDLVFNYPSGVAALSGVSLNLSSGACAALIGQNGAGKTTLAKHLNGLLRPTSGFVLVGGWDTREHSTAQLAARVGYVFQNPDDQLFQSTVRAEVMFGPKNLGWPPEKVSAQTEAALKAVRLEQAAGRHPYDLTPAERRRAALASVLAMDTPIVVLDEPTTGQDYAGVELIGEIVEELKSRGKTVLAISHDIDFCAEHFEQVVVLLNGQILNQGPARTVLSQSQLLAQTYVEPPQVMRLAKRLELPARPLTVSEFVLALKK